MANRVDVMISSTARDLPEHRKMVEDACLRMGMFPVMMERLRASASDAVKESIRMVNEAELYVLILAHKYGSTPEDSDISYTEMEFNRALERHQAGELCDLLVFIMGPKHPLLADAFETDPAKLAKVNALKARARKLIVQEFNSSEELRALSLQSLSQAKCRSTEASAKLLHPHALSDLPRPPDPFIAHPYTLLQTSQLVGRNAELNLLTDWITGKANFRDIRLMHLVAIGGMGKSALTWKWFNDIAPMESNDIAGRLWWSFYESDASFENFVIRALAYVSGTTRDTCEQLSRQDREDRLLAALSQKPYLFVLDGLERILNAYARMDAARMSDDDLDRRTANGVSGAIGLSSAAASFMGQHVLRKTTDPHSGAFLRKLATVSQSRVLITTRLYPSELQIITGNPSPGCSAIFLTGLGNDDALNLWRAFGITGSREELLPLFQSFDNYPLLIRALAGEVSTSRRANRNFDVWRKANPSFNPLNVPPINVKAHVLEFALRDLSIPAQNILETLAAFRMPASYDTLASLLVGKGKPCETENNLDDLLTTLEDRGLVGWDRIANRYDLHPVVRGTIWQTMSDDTRQAVYTTLSTHFESIPIPDDNNIERYEDLTPAIELYYALIARGRFDDAEKFFYDRLSKVTLYRLRVARQRIELLEMLFPDGLESPPHLMRLDAQAFTLNALALAYDLNGQPKRASSFYRRYIEISERRKDNHEINIGLQNLSTALRLSGSLYEAEFVVRRSLHLSRETENRFKEAISLYSLG
jgi:hypothetical protein